MEESTNGRQAVAILGLPGLRKVETFSTVPARAIFCRDGSREFFIASGGELLRVIEGSSEQVMTLATSSGPVWIDENGVQLFVNDGVIAQIYTFATGVVETISDVDFPFGARGGVYLAGRFWVYTISGDKAGRVYASNVKDGLEWDGLNYIEPASKPDAIVTVTRHADDLMIIGRGSIEWWGAAPVTIPGALGFQPSASANTEVGGVSEYGHAKVGQDLFFIGESSGDLGIYRANGYEVLPIASPQIEEDTKKLSLGSAVCTGYTALGHGLFQVTIQGTDTTQAHTWVYDASAGEWSDRESHGKPYYRGLFAIGAAGRVYISDAFTGVLYHMDESLYTEDGMVLPFRVTSQHLLKEGDHITIHSIQVDMETGLGTAVPPGDDPHGIMRVSKDGGYTWPIERHISLGKQGHYTRRAKSDQFGIARDFAIEFSISDPIPRRVTGAYLTIDPCIA